MDTNDAPTAGVAVAEGPGSLEADRALHDAARAGDAAAVRALRHTDVRVCL